MALDLRKLPARVDTLANIGIVYFPEISPDGRFLLSSWPAQGSMITTFPRPGRLSRIPGAVEAVWVSATTVRYQQDPSMDWFEMSVDSVSGEARGAPRPYFSDPRYVQPPGLSHRAVSNGGMVYVQGPARTSASYLRVVPNWVGKMKLAVDSAGEKPE
jgi:hypothetical protein